MDASARSSSNALWVFTGALAALVACSDQLAPLEGVSSLRVEVTDPSDLGSRDSPLADAELTVTVAISAIDAQGHVDPSFSGNIDLYVHYLGGLTPELSSVDSLLSTAIASGRADGIRVTMPRVFGPVFLWAEHSRGDAPTFATGTSPVLQFRNAFLEDVSRPPNEMALDAFEASPLEEKQILINESRYGERGRLIVTGVYAQGYTLSDVECTDSGGTPPCTTGDYDSIYVFSFSRAEYEGGGSVAVGDEISGLAGAVSEFNGLTEVGFPQTFASEAMTQPDRVPAPTVIEAEWLDAANRIRLERAESGLVAVENATLCALDDAFATFSQWKLDVGNGCDDSTRVINVISAGQVAEFSPENHVGKQLPRVVGTLRPVNIGSFHVWIVFPRSMNDIVLPSES